MLSGFLLNRIDILFSIFYLFKYTWQTSEQSITSQKIYIKTKHINEVFMMVFRLCQIKLCFLIDFDGFLVSFV